MDQGKWELAKDLVRFLRAIDPNDVESPRTSFVLPPKFGMSPQTPPVSPNAEDLSVILGSVQVTRGRSFSTTVQPKITPENTLQKSISNIESPVTVRKKSTNSTTKNENRLVFYNITKISIFILFFLVKHLEVQKNFSLTSSYNVTLVNYYQTAD